MMLLSKGGLQPELLNANLNMHYTWRPSVLRLPTVTESVAIYIRGSAAVSCLPQTHKTNATIRSPSHVTRHRPPPLCHICPHLAPTLRFLPCVKVHPIIAFCGIFEFAVLGSCCLGGGDTRHQTSAFFEVLCVCVLFRPLPLS